MAPMASPSPAPMMSAPAAKPEMAPSAPADKASPLTTPATSPSLPTTTPSAPGAPASPSFELPTIKGTTFYEPTAGDSGVLTVWVPFNAKVTINGLVTKSTGSKRQFVSYGLRHGETYKYDVKAEIVRDGKIQSESQSISLAAGEHEAVAFGFNTVSSETLAQSDSSK